MIFLRKPVNEKCQRVGLVLVGRSPDSANSVALGSVHNMDLHGFIGGFERLTIARFHGDWIADETALLDWGVASWDTFCVTDT